MNAPALLATLAWLLSAAATVVFLGPLTVGGGYADLLKSAVPAGVLLALAGHLFTQSKTFAEAAEKRSLFNLEGFTAAIEHAKALLADGNNDRATWIEAARSLSEGEQLAQGVVLDAHRRVLELRRLAHRRFFHGVLIGKGSEFFYGVPAVFESMDEAAKASTASSLVNGRHVVSQLRELDEASLYSIWLAAGWPESYQEPMRPRFPPEQKARVMLLFPEMHAFFEHKANWHSAAGKLHRKSDEP